MSGATYEERLLATYEERLLQRLESATVVEEWVGSVFLHDWGSNYGYFQDMSDFVEYLDNMHTGVPRPKWAFVAERIPVKLDIDTIIEKAIDEVVACGSDFVPHDAKADLAAAVERFNAAIKDRLWIYEEDLSRKVAIPALDCEGGNGKSA